MEVMERIMLRYRPIAPKPLATGTTPCLKVVSGEAAKKRKGGSCGAKRGRRSKKLVDDVVTLPLMPVTPERKERLQDVASPLLLPAVGFPSPTVSKASETVLVTVESVTAAWSVGVFASHDEELKRWLEAGDCPAFGSVGDGIVWTNVAFRRMVVGGCVGGESSSPSSSSSSYGSTSGLDSLSEGLVEEGVRVVLVTRGLVPGEKCQAFSCMASVRYACGRRGKVSLAVPCDAWRLKDGGLAWRLDVKAALSLCAGN